MEMSVKDVAKDNEECVCLTGRQDLAFMNTGYQVKTLTGNAEEDSSSLNAMNVLAESGVLNTPINSGASQQAVQNVNMLEAKLRQAQDRLTALEQERDQSPDINVLDPAYAAKRQAAKEQERVVDAISEQLIKAENDLASIRKTYNSEGSIFTMTSVELVSRVDQFLTDLYRKLDTPHQEFEKAIRGDLMPQTPTNVSGLTGAQINPPSEFAPPFSEPNRYMLGDSSATNGAVQTNVQNIEKAWSNFGKNLRKNAKRTSLSKQISQDQASVQRLTKTRNQLAQQQASHAKVIGVNVAKSIEKIDQQIAKLQKEIDDNQAKLSTNV
jgi:DNA repair exonuclease SbcCD ATPase subunit